MERRWQVMKTQTIDLGYEQLLVFDGLADGQARVQFRGTWIGTRLRHEDGAALDAGPSRYAPSSPTWQLLGTVKAALRGVRGGFDRFASFVRVRPRVCSATEALS